MAGGFDVNFNYSWLQGANTELGTVTNHLLPYIIVALRKKTKLINLVSKDFSNVIAKAGDTITWEKMMELPTVLDLTSQSLSYHTFEITKDYAKLDRWVAVPYTVEELSMLLPENSAQHWDAFMFATIVALANYIETDIADLYAYMTNSYVINGGLDKDHFPILEDLISDSSEDDEGPWAFLISRYDYLNLTTDDDLKNMAFADTVEVMRKARLFELANITAMRWRFVPEVVISDDESYNTLFHNILFNKRAIQFFSRRLGVPKYSSNTTFIEISDPMSGLNFRIRLTYDATVSQPVWKIVVEILYSVKLVRTEYAIDVTTKHSVT